MMRLNRLLVNFDTEEELNAVLQKTSITVCEWDLDGLYIEFDLDGFDVEDLVKELNRIKEEN